MATLVAARSADIDELMTWFPDAAATEIWGGPAVRYPLLRDAFHEDCRWREIASFRLQITTAPFAAFGQLDERYGRSHLARLIVRPALRGQGLGVQLVNAMLEEARRRYAHTECGLFAFRDNVAALRCYQSAGFSIQAYPDDAPMPDRCCYLTRSL